MFGGQGSDYEVIEDSARRSRNKIRILRTDGDGIFGRSESFQRLLVKEKFIHERPAPYDHRQSSKIDRECGNVARGVNTALAQRGAPPNFWSAAASHFIFTRNILPRIESEKGGKNFSSPDSILENRKVEFNLIHLVAFGTQVTCYLPIDRRLVVKHLVN